MQGINSKGGGPAIITAVADFLTGELVPVGKVRRVVVVKGTGNLRSESQEFVGPESWRFLQIWGCGTLSDGTFTVSSKTAAAVATWSWWFCPAL